MKAINLPKLAVKTLKFDGATERFCHVRSRVDAIDGTCIAVANHKGHTQPSEPIKHYEEMHVADWMTKWHKLFTVTHVAWWCKTKSKCILDRVLHIRR